MNINSTELYPAHLWIALLTPLVAFMAGKTLIYFYRKTKELNELRKGAQRIEQKLSQHQDYIKTYFIKNLISQNLPQPRIASVQKEKSRTIEEIKKRRDSLNRAYLDKHLKAPEKFFKEDNLLTEEQIESIVVDDDRNLVIAGAGSGKTRIIINKIKYLIEHKKVKPDEFLLLSFTKASVADLNQKLGGLCSARTLHSFSYEIARSSSPTRFTIKDDIAGVAHDILQAQLRDQNNLGDFLRFYRALFNYESKPLTHYNSVQELRENLDEKSIKYRISHNKFGETDIDRHIRTLRGDWVRSVDERFIADFLFIHDIDYEYERQYPGCQYHPDFYLTSHDIYIEHFALGEAGQPVPIIGDPERYLKGIEWKRNLHKHRKTRLIETFTGLLNKEDSHSYLKATLEENGIRVAQTRTDFLSVGYARFATSFYNRYQLSGLSLDELKIRATQEGPSYFEFYQFISTFIKNLESLKQNRGFITFSDQLIRAKEVYESGKGRAFKYIIVDEFQDTNRLALDLLEEVHRFSEGYLAARG